MERISRLSPLNIGISAGSSRRFWIRGRDCEFPIHPSTQTANPLSGPSDECKKGIDMLDGRAGFQQFRANLGEAADAPEDPLLQRFKLEVVPVFVEVGYEDAGKFLSQALVPRHHFAHDFRNAPPDPPGLLIQLPHEPAHPIAGCFQIVFSQFRNINPQGYNRRPFHRLILAA